MMMMTMMMMMVVVMVVMLSNNLRRVQVSVGVKALPVPTNNNDYLCVFGANWTVIGAVSPNEIKCFTPPPNIFASVFHSHHQGMSECER